MGLLTLSETCSRGQLVPLNPGEPRIQKRDSRPTAVNARQLPPSFSLFPKRVQASNRLRLSPPEQKFKFGISILAPLMLSNYPLAFSL